ncbi:MAG TPA: head decoration protein [Chloroflexota bacterium]|nr:head decoration protein [Chloroflexota bacterium]
MAYLTLPPLDEGFVVSEQRGSLSRENITVASGSGYLFAGTVLGEVTATGKYVPVSLTATDGSQTAAAVLLRHLDATSADAAGAAIVRLAEIRSNALTWPAGATSTEIAAFLASLKSTYVVAR